MIKVTWTKKLSVNSVHSRRYLSEGNDCGRQMIDTEEVMFQFFVSNGEFAEPIEPAAGYLDDPATGTLARMFSLRSRVLATTDDVWDIAMGDHDLERGRSDVTRIGAKVLAATELGIGLRHGDGVEDGAHLADIMPICSGHDDRERDATTVHQQAALAPIFCPIRRVWPHGFLRQRGFPPPHRGPPDEASGSAGSHSRQASTHHDLQPGDTVPEGPGKPPVGRSARAGSRVPVSWQSAATL